MTVPYDQLFRVRILDPKRSPFWINGGEGTKYLYTLGTAHDGFAAEHERRLRSSLPGYSTPELITQIGIDRHILLFPEESFASKIERCREWLPAHFDAGLWYGIARQMQLLWLPAAPRVRLVAGNQERVQWATLEASGAMTFHRRGGLTGLSPNWDWDSAFPGTTTPIANNHRFFGIVYAPDGYVEHGTEAGPSDAESLGSPSVSHQMGLNVAAVQRYWMKAGAQLWGWILAFDPDSFDPTLTNIDAPGGYPDGTWYKAHKTGGGFNRLQTARYYEIRDPLDT